MVVKREPELEPARSYHGAAVPLRVIRRYARQIAERFQPDKIILFGSHAYGTPHADSDVDLLVVMPARYELGQAFKIRVALPAPFPMDLLVRTPKNFQGRLDDGESFTTDIVTRGKVLYKKADAGVGTQGRGGSPTRTTNRPRRGTVS